jgi:hypothetical protein
MALKTLYIVILRSSQDYGSVEYASAAQASFKKARCNPGSSMQSGWRK